MSAGPVSGQDPYGQAAERMMSTRAPQAAAAPAPVASPSGPPEVASSAPPKQGGGQEYGKGRIVDVYA